MDYRIIDLSKEHIPQLCRIEKECFSCPWTAGQLKTQLKDDMHEFIGAMDADGNVLGYVGMSYILDEGYISNVAVAVGSRRGGIGERLVRELLRRAEGLCLSFVTLEVREGNIPAVGLYSKLGFEPVGRRKGYYVKPKEDAVLMTYFLK